MIDDDIVQAHIRAPTKLWNEVRKASKLQTVSHSDVVVAALKQMFDKDSAIDKKSISARLSRIERSVKELRSDMEISLEVLFHFIFHWFCYTPPLPADDKETLVSEAEERYDRFVALLRSRFDKGEFRTSAIFQQKVHAEENGSTKTDIAVNE